MKNHYISYLELIKPRIIFGNLISMSGAFFLASKGLINFNLLLLNIIGMFFVISSACILNNIIDCNIDKKMERTKNRVLAISLLPKNIMFILAIIFFCIGIYDLYYFVNYLSMLLAILGFIFYVVFYSIYMKKNSIYSTFVGSISGAIPPVIGYCAVNNQLNICTIILLLIFIFWQVPHSYAIYIIYLKDYKNANIPVFPIKKGIWITKYYIFLYIFLFLIFSVMLTILGYTGYKYLLSTMFVGILWLYLSWTGFYIYNDIIWARKIFRFSLISIFIISIMMAIDFIN